MNPKKKPKKKSSQPPPAKTRRKSKPSNRKALDGVISLTDNFCQQHLNEEYAVLCRKLAETLGAKSPSPLVRGNPSTWACGIIRAIGWANFLGDRTQTPYLKPPAIDKFFGVAESTAQGKASAIRQMAEIHRFHHEWMCPSHWENCGLIWTLRNPRGMLVDMRNEPAAAQREAFQQGLIPYVPADRAAEEFRAKILASNSRRLFQFKIILEETDPIIWRRIQVLDDTLDQLHQHIQMAMGWANSHLYRFTIRGQVYGDLELVDDGSGSSGARDSTRTLMSDAAPVEGTPFSFEYMYDFGDRWRHQVLFEGCLPPQEGATYPLCLEGARACPPEDVGGLAGFQVYLEAIADPNHERRQELLEWNGPFNPDAFTPRHATHAMQEGMPDWKRLGPIK